jgi:hypothetical protein
MGTEIVVDDIRDYLFAITSALLVALTAAVDEKIRKTGAKGPRPQLPYLEVRVNAVGGDELGPSERVNGLNVSTPEARMHQRREATITIQGFGSGAYDWLDAFVTNIDSPASLALQETTRTAMLLRAQLTDLSQVLDTQEEFRTILELTCRYTRTGDVSDLVELLTADITSTLRRYDGDADTLDASQTISLS